MSTVKDLKDSLNLEGLVKDSLIIVVKDGKFAIPQENRFGYLNVDGHYGYKIDDEVVYSDKKYGDVFSLWSILQGDIEFNYRNDIERMGGMFDLEYNMNFDGFNSSYLTVGKAKKQLDRYNDGADIVNIGMNDDPFITIDSMEVINNVYLDTTDSYGHKKKLNYKFPCLILNYGKSIDRFFDPKEKANESRIIKKFNKFK